MHLSLRLSSLTQSTRDPIPFNACASGCNKRFLKIHRGPRAV